MDTCPVLTLLPVVSTSDAQTLQENFNRIRAWTIAMCQYAATLEARIEALEP